MQCFLTPGLQKEAHYFKNFARISSWANIQGGGGGGGVGEVVEGDHLSSEVFQMQKSENET